MDLEEFGRSLRARREDAGLSLAEVSLRTKIHIRQLQALERGDLMALPGRVYARAFVKHYARAVGLDPDETAASFDIACGDLADIPGVWGSSRRSRRARSLRRRGQRWPWAWFVVIAVVLGGLALSMLISTPR